MFKEVIFSKRLIKANGSRRKSFRTFQVPFYLRNSLGIIDGMELDILIIAENRVIDAGVCRVTSGGEISLPIKIGYSLSILKCESIDFKLIRFSDKTDSDLYLKIKEARELSEGELQDKILSSPEKPTYVLIKRYNRSEHVIAAVLNRAADSCERCRMSGPFVRASDASVYLEVHHIIPLSQGGKDRPENCMALCPNCHREAHYGSTGLAFQNPN